MAFPIDNAILRDAVVAAGWPEPEPGVLHIFGIRGAVPWEGSLPGEYWLTLKTNHPDEWNDTIGLFGTAFGTWRGTVDPGLPYTLDPLSPGGCAHLEDGDWLYQEGLHKGNPALVQAAPVTVRRDADKDSQAEAHEKTETGYLGINIHAGTGLHVSEWSAGCQVVYSDNGWSGPQWTAFFDAVQASGQSTWHYYLLDAADVSPA